MNRVWFCTYFCFAVINTRHETAGFQLLDSCIWAHRFQTVTATILTISFNLTVYLSKHCIYFQMLFKSLFFHFAMKIWLYTLGFKTMSTLLIMRLDAQEHPHGKSHWRKCVKLCVFVKEIQKEFPHCLSLTLQACVGLQPDTDELVCMF